MRKQHRKFFAQAAQFIPMLGGERTQDRLAVSGERDRRVTRVALTREGETILRALTAEHRDELRRLREELAMLLTHFAEEEDDAPVAITTSTLYHADAP